MKNKRFTRKEKPDPNGIHGVREISIVVKKISKV